MDFSYTEEQQMLQESVQKFVNNQYDFYARKAIMESDGGYSQEHWQMFAELGWLTVPFAEVDGGFGGSAVDLMVMMEEFGKAMLVEPYLGSAVLAGRLLAELGEGDARDAMLGELMEGKLQLALAAAERSARFNLASVATTATADGDAIVINGMKVAVLNGPAADKLLVVARESGDTIDESGISVFVVDAKAEGVTVQGFPNVDGRQSAEVLFEDVRVTEADRLGARGEAFSALESVVDWATVAVAAEAVGAMESLLTKTVEYSKTRKQFGVPIGTFQALQHRMADMFVECQLAKSIVVMAAMKLDSQEDAVAKKKAVSAAKSRVGKAIRKVGQEAVQIHGGIGTTEELDVGHLFKSITGIEMLFGNTDYHTRRFAAL